MAREDLDHRLGQIKEGAGLEDSRINQEFVEFIRKWSTPVLLVAALIALGYFWNAKRKEARAAHVDKAFQQYNLTIGAGTPSPDALRRIAQDYHDVPGVHVLALMDAADQYLDAVQRGVKPASAVDPQTGEYTNPEDVLTDADREEFLRQAEALYRQVFDTTSGKRGMELHTLGALYGLAALAESRGDADTARNLLDRAAALAEANRFVEQYAVARMRLDALPTLLAGEPHLPSKAELPEIPALAPQPPEEPAPADTGAAAPPQPEGQAPDQPEAGQAETDAPETPPADQAGEGQSGDGGTTDGGR